MSMIDLLLRGGPVALVVAAFGFLWYVLTQMERRFSYEIARLEKEIETRLEARLTKMEEKIDRLTERLSELLGRRVS